MGSRVRTARGVLALILVAALSGCAALAASTGGPLERIAADVHTQVRTAGLAAEAGSQDPPAPAVTLTVVLDEAEQALAKSREELAAEPGDHSELDGLCEDALSAVREIRSAIEGGDREALLAAREENDAIAAAIEDWSDLL
jgi:hypothetical protein